MTFDYKELERRLEEACEEVHKDFLDKFKDNEAYISAGGAKLEIFFTDLQKEFADAAVTFIKKNGLESDPEAKKRALTITKLYAKRCVDDYSRV